jgi:hypothetical protein
MARACRAFPRLLVFCFFLLLLLFNDIHSHPLRVAHRQAMKTDTRPYARGFRHMGAWGCECHSSKCSTSCRLPLTSGWHRHRWGDQKIASSNAKEDRHIPVMVMPLSIDGERHAAQPRQPRDGRKSGGAHDCDCCGSRKRAWIPARAQQVEVGERCIVSSPTAAKSKCLAHARKCLRPQLPTFERCDAGGCRLHALETLQDFALPRER